jgi:hypothetical protein
VCWSLLLAGPAKSECECLWQGAFTEVQSGTDLVVSGRVVASKGNSIDLLLLRKLRGSEYRERIRIWLDVEDLCRAPVGSFPLDSMWVMALDRIDAQIPGGFNPNTPNISYGRVGDYSLSRCGGYWLSQSENLVSGNLTGGPRWEMEPKMSPVLLDLVAAYVAGQLDKEALVEAGRVNPRLQELMINTRLFVRGQQ